MSFGKGNKRVVWRIAQREVARMLFHHFYGERVAGRHPCGRG